MEKTKTCKDPVTGLDKCEKCTGDWCCTYMYYAQPKKYPRFLTTEEEKKVKISANKAAERYLATKIKKA